MKQFTLFFVLFTMLAHAQFTTPGTGVIWNADSLVARSGGVVTVGGSGYSVSALVTVAAGDAVIIPAGTQMTFTSATAGFAVNGIFRAIGTEANRITFTAATADSLGGSFSGFVFNDTSIDSLCRIANANITYAYYGLRCIDASPSFAGNYVFKCRRGVQLSGSSPRIERNIIARSYEYGITMTLGSSPTIEYNDIYDNNTQNTSAKNQISIGTQGTNSPIVRFNKVHGSLNTKTGGISVASLLGNASGGQIIGNEIYGNSFGIVLSGGTVNTVVMNNIIYNNNINPDANTSGSGININGNAANTPYIAKNLIANNYWGITIQNGTTIQAGPQPFLGNIMSGNPLEQGMNVFRNNSHGGVKYDLYNNCTNDILAQNNDWGVYDSVGIEERITHKTDNAQLGLITFSPFSNSLQVRVTEPNGGEIWRMGATKNIRWFSFSTAKVKIEFSADNGVTWSTVADSVIADSGKYAWTVPSIASAQCRVRISDASNLTITDMSDSVFTISNLLCKDVTYAAGWNLVSLPLGTATYNPDSLFVGTNSATYGFAGGYQTTTTLVPGKGYWLRFAAATTNTFCGIPLNTENVAITPGWNLIGPYHYPVVVSAITSTPAGIITSVMYGYNAGYTVATELIPGKGYWVRSSQSGLLTLPSTALTNKSATFMQKEPEGRIRLTDAAGNSQTLYITMQGNCGQYALPPMPPAGIFDIRFTTGNAAADVNSTGIAAINNAKYPVTISTEGVHVTVTDAGSNGKLFSQQLAAGASVVLNNPAVSELIIQTGSIARSFSLQQNYPNPFNPETKISYMVPQSSKVTLEVFDVLGAKVATLTNAVQESGSYTVSFNATGLSSGMYFYRLQANGNTAIKKMLIIK